jgi:hypothetical protein
MITWHDVTDIDPITWNGWLDGFESSSVFQSHAWGEHKKDLGWRPLRWAAYDDSGSVQALFQALTRKYPGSTGLIWGPGGPLGDSLLWNEDLRTQLRQAIGAKRMYCRIFPQVSYGAEMTLNMNSTGWKRSMHPMGSGLSMLLDLREQNNGFPASASGNWRHNLRRTSRQALLLKRETGTAVETLMRGYRSMEGFKDLAQQWTEPQLQSLCRAFGDSLVLYTCWNEQAELLGFRACVVLGCKAWDMLAATTVEGRRVYAAYALFAKLAEECKARGAHTYDMMGIDPLNNRGVYDFKKGTGAVAIEYMGEWEWASTEWLRWAANAAIARRGGTL